MEESALTTNANGTTWMLLIGVTPLIGSCGQFGNTFGPMLSVLFEPISSVCPSGFALVTVPAPIMPPAPDQFSTTTG